MKAFWRKEWMSLQDKQRSAEVEIDVIIDTLDSDADIQELLGRDSGAIRHEKRKDDEKGQKSTDSTWQQVSRFRQVVDEVKTRKPTASRTHEIQGLVAEVLAAIDTEEDLWNLEMNNFMRNEKDVLALQRDLNEGDKVKGFDLEENIDVDLLLDLSKYSDYIGEQEQAMIDDFYTSCQILVEKRDLEIQAVEANDVRNIFISSTTLYVTLMACLTTSEICTSQCRGSAIRKQSLESFILSC